MAPFAGSKTSFSSHVSLLFFNKNSWDISSLYFVESTRALCTVRVPESNHRTKIVPESIRFSIHYY